MNMLKVPGVRCQVSGVRCQVPGARCQVSGVRCVVADVRCQVSDVRCEAPAPGPGYRGTKWAWLFRERSEFDDVNAQRPMLPTIQYPMINGSSDQRSMLPMMDWSTGLISFLRGSSSRTRLFAFWAPLRRRLGGSREALGRLLEASKRYLGPKTVIGNIFGRFWKNMKIWASILATF